MKRSYLNRKPHAKHKNKSGKLNPYSKRRSKEMQEYYARRATFLELHKTCPVTGERATEIHHTAHREGKWLNLERYWVALSRAGHLYTHAHPWWASGVGLFVSIPFTYQSHISVLHAAGEDLNHPVFYDQWPDGTPVPRF